MAKPNEDEVYHLVERPGGCVNAIVFSKEEAVLFSAAPLMLKALENLENDNGVIPEFAWRMVQNAIKTAKTLPE